MRRLAAAVLLVVQPAAAAEGEAVFRRHCANCHAVAAGAPAGPGPNLGGVAGRRVGGDPGFDYSPVLQAAGEAGQRWDAEMLERFLADPEAMFPGLWMGANGLREAADRAAVARYLAERATP